MFAQLMGSEAEVLRFIVMIRKLAEVDDSQDTPDLRRLRFYLSIPLHRKLKRKSAGDFLREVAGPVSAMISASARGLPLPAEETRKLGSLVSFADLKKLMAELMRRKDVSVDMFDDAKRWTAFAAIYVKLISETGITLQLPSHMIGDVVEATIGIPLIPDDNPKTLAWDWRFRMKNGDTVSLRHSLDVTTMQEQDAPDVLIAQG
jgi:hypothetical protein